MRLQLRQHEPASPMTTRATSIGTWMAKPVVELGRDAVVHQGPRVVPSRSELCDKESKSVHGSAALLPERESNELVVADGNAAHHEAQAGPRPMQVGRGGYL